ncbi:hypothetical protein MIR68_010732 [Amoeboaphelidium protococcarum]|nr:hypothetical protein MIR68_010732 [Amoeboaphelidium protococcarum]
MSMMERIGKTIEDADILYGVMRNISSRNSDQFTLYISGHFKALMPSYDCFQQLLNVLIQSVNTSQLDSYTQDYGAGSLFLLQKVLLYAQYCQKSQNVALTSLQQALLMFTIKCGRESLLQIALDPIFQQMTSQSSESERNSLIGLSEDDELSYQAVFNVQMNDAFDMVQSDVDRLTSRDDTQQRQSSSQSKSRAYNMKRNSQTIELPDQVSIDQDDVEIVNQQEWESELRVKRRREYIDDMEQDWMNRDTLPFDISTEGALSHNNFNAEDFKLAEGVYLPRFCYDKVKKHQVEGVRFMWQNLQSGHGCVLAHSMGLMKTFQVILLMHILCQTAQQQPELLPSALRRQGQVTLKILILMPATLIENWIQEIYRWIPRRDIQSVFNDSIIHIRLYANVHERRDKVRQWSQGGGLLLMGFEMFRQLFINDAVVQDIFLNRGPHLIVVDEAHRLKNHQSKVNIILRRIQCQYKICLTGSPLQNNLLEYYVMVDSVYPGYLGTLQDFRLTFMHPITDGLSMDSTPVQKSICRQSLYVLQQLLQPLVHRLCIKDFDALMQEANNDNDLVDLADLLHTRKFEFSIAVKLTPVQQHLYEEYLKCCGHFVESDDAFNTTECDELDYALQLNQDGSAQVNKESNSQLLQVSRVDLLTHYQELLRLVNHPACSYNLIIQNEKKQMSSTLQQISNAALSVEHTDGDDNDDEISGSVAAQTSRQKSFSEPAFASEHVKTVGDMDQDFEEDDDYESILLQSQSTKKQDEPGLKSFHEEVKAIPNIVNIANSHKFQIAFQIIKEARRDGDKVLLFSRSIPTLDMVEQKIKQVENFRGSGISYLRLDGKVPTAQRQSLIDKFNQDPEIDVFLISISAGGVGVNLQSANRVIIFDAGWNPTLDQQAIARAYRFGQKKNVYVYRLYTFGTIEDALYKLNVKKTSLFKSVVDQESMSSWFPKNELKLYFRAPPRNIKSFSIDQDLLQNDPLLKRIMDTYRNVVVQLNDYSDLIRGFSQQLTSHELLQANAKLRQEQHRIRSLKLG